MVAPRRARQTKGAGAGVAGQKMTKHELNAFDALRVLSLGCWLLSYCADRKRHGAVSLRAQVDPRLASKEDASTSSALISTSQLSRMPGLKRHRTPMGGDETSSDVDSTNESFPQHSSQCVFL